MLLAGETPDCLFGDKCFQMFREKELICCQFSQALKSAGDTIQYSHFIKTEKSSLKSIRGECIHVHACAHMSP